MTFQYRLETLLRLRIAERDQRRADLAKALRAEEALRGQERQLLAQQAELQTAARELAAPGTGDIDGLLRTHRYQIVLKTQRQQLAAQIAQVEAEVARRRQVLVEADRGVRVLEMLRERQLAAHRKAEERQEIKVFDELALLGHARRARVPL